MVWCPNPQAIFVRFIKNTIILTYSSPKSKRRRQGLSYRKFLVALLRSQTSALSITNGNKRHHGMVLLLDAAAATIARHEVILVTHLKPGQLLKARTVHTDSLIEQRWVERVNVAERVYNTVMYQIFCRCGHTWPPTHDHCRCLCGISMLQGYSQILRKALHYTNLPRMQW